MINDLDIWRAAQVMIKHYSDGAATEAAMRADEFLDQGNLDGKRLWMRIMQARLCLSDNVLSQCHVNIVSTSASASIVTLWHPERRLPTWWIKGRLV